MRKGLLGMITLCCVTLTVTSQTTKDWYLIGGNIANINLDFQKNNTAFAFNLYPRVAWFIKDDLAVGAEALLGLNTSTGYTAVSYGVGPVARYYLGTPGLESVKKTRWFLDGNVGIYGQNTKVSGTSSVSTNGLGFGFGPGLAYFLNQNIALEGLVKYNLTVGFGSSVTTNSLNAAFGFQIYLPKAKLNSMKKDVQ